MPHCVTGDNEVVLQQMKQSHVKGYNSTGPGLKGQGDHTFVISHTPRGCIPMGLVTSHILFSEWQHMVTIPFTPDPKVPSPKEDRRPQGAVSFCPSSPWDLVIERIEGPCQALSAGEAAYSLTYEPSSDGSQSHLPLAFQSNTEE